MEVGNKLAEAPSDGNAQTVQSSGPADLESVATSIPPATQPTQSPPQPTPPPPPVPWHLFLRAAKANDIRERFAREVGEILESERIDGYCCLGLLEPEDSI